MTRRWQDRFALLLASGALSLASFGLRSVHAEVAAQGATKAASDREPARATDQRSGTLEPRQPAGDGPDVLTFHRSTYFLTGFTQQTQGKFQFSIKFDLWPSKSAHTAYFAYTQVSLWDIYEPSLPFRESNYAPEAFYVHYHSRVRGQPDPGCGLFAEQLGIEHESNGESSELSRSWNRIFGNVEFTCHGKPFYALSGLRLWYPLAYSENEEIVETQGYEELLLGAGIDDIDSHINGLVTVALRKGMSRQLAKGNVTVDARYRPVYEQIFGSAWKLAPFIWFQLFTGYGETLGDYDRSVTSLRVGIGFTDRTR
jgi:phospholipase A1/A2